MKMDAEHHAAVAGWKDEIEHAIDNVKRTKLDKWMRREWHRAGARERWAEDRKAEWEDWRRRRRRETGKGNSQRLGRRCTTQAKVWVKGRVPREFLGWVERHWSHDGETKAMLNECCFEVWER